MITLEEITLNEYVKNLHTLVKKFKEYVENSSNENIKKYTCVNLTTAIVKKNQTEIRITNSWPKKGLIECLDNIIQQP